MAIVFNNLSGGGGSKLYRHNITVSMGNDYSINFEVIASDGTKLSNETTLIQLLRDNIGDYRVTNANGIYGTVGIVQGVGVRPDSSYLNINYCEITYDTTTSKIILTKKFSNQSTFNITDTVTEL